MNRGARIASARIPAELRGGRVDSPAVVDVIRGVVVEEELEHWLVYLAPNQHSSLLDLI